MDTVAEIEAAEVHPGRAAARRGPRARGHRRGQDRRLGLDPGLRHRRRRRAQGHRPRHRPARDAVDRPLLAPVGRGARRRLALHRQGPGDRTRHRRPPQQPRPARPRRAVPAHRGQGTRCHRAQEAHPPAAHRPGPRRRGPPRRTRAGPARTRRPPGPTLHPHRGPRRRRLDQRPLQHRGRRPHQSRPDAARRTPPQHRPGLRPRHLRRPRAAATTAATPATTASGCSTPSSRPADDSRPPTCSPSAHGATPRSPSPWTSTDLRDQTGYGTTETGEQLTATTIRRSAATPR